MKQITSRVLRLVEATDRPERRLEQLGCYPHQHESGYFVRLYDDIVTPTGVIQGNIVDAVSQLQGDDVPCPEAAYRPILVNELRQRLSTGETLYLFVLTGYVYYDDFEDEMDPSKPEYVQLRRNPKTGWYTIDEVCQIRDIDKSTVTRAIYSRELTCGLSEEDGRRYIKIDELFDNWRPDRKRSYLRDRRLLILYEVLLNEHVYTIDELYYRIEQIEGQRFGGYHLPGEGLDQFFDDVIPECPQSLISWRARIHEICLSFGLHEPKKIRRGLGDRQAA